MRELLGCRYICERLRLFGCPLITDVFSSLSLCLSLSIEEPMLLGAEDDREEKPALVPSLFPLIPPTLYFSTANEKGQDTHICCEADCSHNSS